MDYLYLEKTVKEVSQKLTKQRLSQVSLEGKKLTLTFNKELHLNAYFSNPNALFLSVASVAAQSFPPLSPLKGAYLKEISLPYPDRVIELTFVKLLSPTEFQKLYLIFELTGKNANLFLLDGERRIKFLLRPVLSSVRELSVKDEYRPPPLDKEPFEELSFGQITPEGIEEGLYKYALYISPLNAREIACIYKEVGDLKKAYEAFMEKHRKSSVACLYYKNKKPAYLTTFPYCSLEGLEFKKFSGELPYSRAWEELFKERVLRGEVEELKKRVLNRLRKRKEALLKELGELGSREELLREAEKFKRWGELLKFNLHLVKPGLTAVTLTDYETGGEVSIPLEPSLSPQKNLKRLFKEYRKRVKKAQIWEERRREIGEELCEVESLIEVVESLEDAKRLRELLPALCKRGKKGEKSYGFRVFTLPSGKKLIVGRSSRENELISLKLSNPWDLWFHAKETPGSHAVLRLKRGEEPTEEDLLLAASAAAYFSKAKNSGKTPVDYTQVKRLKKPPKSPVGFVIYSGEKTVWVKPEVFEKFLKEGKSPAEGACQLTEKRQ